MNFLKSLLDKTKPELDIYFFYGFLLSFTLNIRKVLFYFPIDGIFNEYSGIYLYLSDIFLIFTLFSWQLNILCNKRISLSNIKLWISEFFHNLYIFLPFILILWSFFSIIWSQNQSLALFRSIKFLEFYLLYIYVLFRIVPRGTISVTNKHIFTNCSTWNNLFLVFIILGFIQSFLGMIQFIRQKSIGLYFLKESLISPDIAGVAKIILGGQRYIRSYGLFPHPNILGGFLLISIIFTLMYLKLFHVEQFKDTRLKKTFIKVILLVQILGLVLTFSKSAILGLIIGVGYIYWKIIVPRGTISSPEKSKLLKIRYAPRKLFHVEQFRTILLGLAISLITLIIIIKPDLNSIFIQSLNERYLYLDVSRGTILENPILGSGAGQFVLLMQNFSPVSLQSWQYQPVHNVFLLIWSELGFLGLALFVWILKSMLYPKQPQSRMRLEAEDVPRGTIYFKSILIGLIFISLFDHYLWSIQQGEILLWIILGLIAGITLQFQKERNLLLDNQ